MASSCHVSKHLLDRHTQQAKALNGHVSSSSSKCSRVEQRRISLQPFRRAFTSMGLRPSLRLAVDLVTFQLHPWTASTGSCLQVLAGDLQGQFLQTCASALEDAADGAFCTQKWLEPVWPRCSRLQAGSQGSCRCAWHFGARIMAEQVALVSLKATPSS